MRFKVCNLLRQAADTIEHRRRDEAAYAYMLEQLAEHLALVRDGDETWEDFAEVWCLTERDRPKVAS